MARLLSQRLKPGFEVRLGPVAATESHAGFACAGSYEFCRARTKRFLPASKDPQRSTELRQLLGVCDKELKWRTPCMLMFARVEIIDSTNDCVIGEVDGLAAFAGSRSVNWLLVESKERSTSSGSRQLKRLLKLAFGVQKEKLERIDIGNQTSWFGMIGSNA